jgi:hypothetical protein|nr:MAG TPA_asm: DNA TOPOISOMERASE I [Caudoviricetes sp.]
MKAMSFYTANGWAGSNYDSKLSTKEIAAKVRSYAKKNFPGFKFSVRSEWSMSANLMAVELKAGPCVPFIGGSRSAERGYMSTMSSVKAWKDELTPEIFKALDAVTTYASSFRYDDSDGMQDYFDTNFYLSIEVSDEYKVIEPKAKKSSVKPEKVEEAVTIEGLEIVDYSEKAIAVFGHTKSVKDQLKELGGRFNPSLNYNGEKRAGWIFSKKQADKVKELIAPTELPALPEEIYIPELAEEPQGNDTPLIIDDYAKYDSFDYPTIPEELDGFRLGEVVYDQCGEIGVILAFNEKNGTARVNSNGSCNVGNLKKCPKEIAEREVKHMDIIRSGKALTACTNEAHPLDNIRFTETANFNGVHYYDIEGAGIITSAKVRADIQPGDVFNVYTDKGCKFGVTYDGVSVESSLKNDLPGIIEYNGKIESDTLSISSYYTPMAEGMEFYEKKVKGKRYIMENKPKRGWYVIDTLDNCPVGFFQTKEEAEKEAETLNGFTDGNGRLKTVI